MSQGIIFGILAMIGFGMSNALSKIPAQQLGGLKTIFYRGVGLVIIQFFLLIFLYPVDVTVKGLLIATAVAFFSYIPITFFYKGLEFGKIGIMSPIANSSALITTLLAVFLLGETLRPLQWAGGLFVIVGILLISVNFLDLKNSHIFNSSSGAPYAIIACLGWGITFFLFKFAVSLVGPILTSFMVEFVILILCSLQMRSKGEKFFLPGDYKKYFAGIVFFSVIGPLAYNYGIQSSAVSLVAMFYMANPLVATLYARYSYNEKLSYQQYAGIAVVILGVMGISFFK